jgi:hypothetical protein
MYISVEICKDSLVYITYMLGSLRRVGFLITCFHMMSMQSLSLLRTMRNRSSIQQATIYEIPFNFKLRNYDKMVGLFHPSACYQTSYVSESFMNTQ